MTFCDVNTDHEAAAQCHNDPQVAGSFPLLCGLLLLLAIVRLLRLGTKRR